MESLPSLGLEPNVCRPWAAPSIQSSKSCTLHPSRSPVRGGANKQQGGLTDPQQEPGCLVCDSLHGLFLGFLIQDPLEVADVLAGEGFVFYQTGQHGFGSPVKYPVQEIPAGGQRSATMLIYQYDVAGVSYEASQDVTYLRQFINLHSCRLGLPTSVKYDPQNPGNSLVVSESWMALR